MNAQFSRLVDTLEPRFQQLMAMAPVTYANLPQTLPRCAIYLFSEGDEHLYVGRTGNLRNRLHGHCGSPSTLYASAFAVRLAREESGAIRKDLPPSSRRASLTGDALFDTALTAARIRIGRMDLRYLEERDPVLQALLEIYVATTLRSRYNELDRPRRLTRAGT